MSTETREYLQEGEHIVWESKANPFRLQEAPFITWNLTYYMLLAAAVLVYVVLYIPTAISSGTGSAGIVLAGCIIVFIPAILTFNSINDRNTIIRHLKYIITDRRAMVVNGRDCRAMDIAPDTDFRIVPQANGNQILYIGSTIGSSPAKARTLAVIGDKGSQGKYNGLVFYSIQNAEKACAAAGFGSLK